jgi:hypothetical protein
VPTGATRRDGCLERGVDEPPLGIERRGAVSSIVVETRSGTSGVRTTKMTAVSMTATCTPAVRRSIRMG